MELSTLSSPHAHHRIFGTEDLFSTSTSGLVASTRTTLTRRAAARWGLQGFSAWVSARSVSDEGFGFCSHSRVLGFLDCGLDGKWSHSRRRREVASCWMRRQWRCLSAESEANGSRESSPGSVHFVGVGGAGLSALALLALRQVRFFVVNHLESCASVCSCEFTHAVLGGNLNWNYWLPDGWQVSGSDLLWSEQLDRLKEAGARVYVGHNAAQMLPQGATTPDALVVSSAVGPGNEEVDAASALNVPIFKRDAWLGKLTEGYELIAIAGTHGKSTTTAMLSVVLRNLGEDITAIVGAQVPQFPDGGNTMYGTSRKFVLEADEYDGCFLGVSPSLAVVTNVEWEHVDMFPDEEAVREIFKRFVMRIKPGGYLVICDDSAGAKSLSGFIKEDDETVLGSQSRGKRRVVTYGLGRSSDWRAIMLVPNPQGGTDYTVVYKNRPITRVSLRLPGMYNVLNSLAVIVVMSLLVAQKENDGAKQAIIMKRAAEAASNALGTFSGVRRRFDWIGTVQGCHIIDDYAHHPTEVRAVLQAARQRFDQQPIWVIFQPHTVSRLATFLLDFAPAFSAADRVIVTEVYSARNIQTEKIVTGEDLANAIIGPPAVYIPDLGDVVERLSWELAALDKNAMNDRGNIVLLTLGAGDITELGPRLMQALSVSTA